MPEIFFWGHTHHVRLICILLTNRLNAHLMNQDQTPAIRDVKPNTSGASKPAVSPIKCILISLTDVKAYWLTAVASTPTKLDLQPQCTEMNLSMYQRVVLVANASHPTTSLRRYSVCSMQYIQPRPQADVRHPMTATRKRMESRCSFEIVCSRHAYAGAMVATSVGLSKLLLQKELDQSREKLRYEGCMQIGFLPNFFSCFWLACVSSRKS